MKTVPFLLTIVGFGAWSLGLGFAEPSGSTRQRAPSQSRPDGKHSDHIQGESHASRMSNQNNGTKATAKSHPGPKLPQPFQANGGRSGEKRTNNARTKATSRTAAELRQPGWNKSAGGAKAGPIMSEMERQRRLAMAGLPGTPRPLTKWFLGVRRQSDLSAVASEKAEAATAPSTARDVQERQTLAEPKRCRAPLATALQSGLPETAGQTLSTALPGTPPPNQVVHRPGPGQAFIGGPAIWIARNTAIINGTGMKHKP
jgi:hypothetical protein